MKKEQVLSIIRHTLTFVGGVLVTKGLVNEAVSSEIIGGIMTLVGLLWGVIEKNNR